jgi:beta-phosphoglucomutase-like phosphatase (HAD superfamily)
VGRIDAVIFDCDGTLVDSETLGPSVLFDCLCERGVSRDLLDIRQVRGRNLVDYLAEIEAVCGISLPEDIVLPDYRSRLSEAFRGRLQPIAGAHDLVQAVSSRVPVAVASSAAPTEGNQSPRTRIFRGIAVRVPCRCGEQEERCL